MRTVRSAAWARNRPRRCLAWLLLVLLLVLIALAVRVDAAPRPEPTEPTEPTEPSELARRYADAITGADRDADADAARRDDDGEDEDEGEDGDDDEDDGGGERTSRSGEATGDSRLDPSAPISDDELDDASRDADVARLAAESEALDTETLDTTTGSDALVMRDAEIDPEAALAGADAEIDPEDAAAGADVLAMRDAELDPGDALAGADAAAAAATAGAAEAYEQSVRHQRPSRWGRLDVGVAWRTRWSEPMHAPASHRSELWLVATWRR